MRLLLTLLLLYAPSSSVSGLQLISASLVVDRWPDGVCVADFCLYSPSTAKKGTYLIDA